MSWQFRRFAIVLVVGGLIGGWAASAFAQQGFSRSNGGQSATDLDSAGKQIAFEIVLIDRGPEQVAGETGKHPTAAQILELEKQGKLGSVQRLKLVALENVEARLSLGESAPMVTSRTVRGGTREGGFPAGGFPGTESITYTDLGTTVLVTAKVDKDGSVIASFNIQRSAFAPSKAGDKPEGQDAALPQQPRKVVSTVSTAARLAPGETIVLGGQQTLTGATPGELWVLVTAK